MPVLLYPSKHISSPKNWKLGPTGRHSEIKSIKSIRHPSFIPSTHKHPVVTIQRKIILMKKKRKGKKEKLTDVIKGSS